MQSGFRGCFYWLFSYRELAKTAFLQLDNTTPQLDNKMAKSDNTTGKLDNKMAKLDNTTREFDSKT